MRKYHQLNREERYHMEKLIQEGKTVMQIAISMGFHRSTVYRELNRNSTNKGEYSALEAWRRTKHRRARQDFGPMYKIKDWIEEKILDGLSVGWSPEQICGRLHLEVGFSLSPEAIYKYILKDRKYGGTLYRCLRRRGRRRRLRKKSRFLPTWNPRRSINDRPTEANERSVVGHWERDTMVGATHDGGLLVFTDRKTRTTLLNRITSLEAEETLNKSVERFHREPNLPVTTITNDNGGEFAKHKEIENILGVLVYFAQPYAPWQRGSNEHSIGLIRQFIPKGSNINEISDERIQEIEYAINTRPRKMFNYRSSREVLLNESLILCPKTRHWRYEMAHLKVG